MGVIGLWNEVVRESAALTDIILRLSQEHGCEPRIGIDVSVWLHKAFRKDAAAKVAIGSGGDTSMVDVDIVAKLRTLLDAGAIPVMLFGGNAGGAKLNELLRRHKERSSFRSKAVECLKAEEFTKAVSWFAKAGHRTDAMEDRLRNILRAWNLPFYTMEGKADAGAKRLLESGKIHCVWTSDGDWIIRGCLPLIREDYSGKDGSVLRCRGHNEILWERKLVDSWKNTNWRQWSPACWAMLGAALGCDYNKRMCTPKKFH